jgi:cytochrome c peroxidase
MAAQLGGPNVDQQGVRAVPSLRYVLNRTPVWHKSFVESVAERLREGEEPPTGGLGWDGRFNTLHDQAAFPLLAPNEMANASPDEVVARMRRAPYADGFRKVFGAQIFDDSANAYTPSPASTTTTSTARSGLPRRSSAAWRSSTTPTVATAPFVI